VSALQRVQPRAARQPVIFPVFFCGLLWNTSQTSRFYGFDHHRTEISAPNRNEILRIDPYLQFEHLHPFSPVSGLDLWPLPRVLFPAFLGVITTKVDNPVTSFYCLATVHTFFNVFESDANQAYSEIIVSVSGSHLSPNVEPAFKLFSVI